MKNIQTARYCIFNQDVRKEYKGDILNQFEFSEETRFVDCVVTSPPYWRKRDYGFPEQIGGPDSCPDKYVEEIRDVIESLEPILKKSATLWINFGDVFDGQGFLDLPAKIIEQLTRESLREVSDGDPWGGIDYPVQTELKKVQPKFKCLQRIIWHKPNGRPESCPNRTTQKTEVIYLLAMRNGTHYFDDKAIREETGAKCTNLWRINNESNRSKHTATFPKEFVRRCLELGCPVGVCGSCGANLGRKYTIEEPDKAWLDYCGAQSGGDYTGKNLKDYTGTKAEPASDAKRRILASMKKYIPGPVSLCTCGQGALVPPVVLDPFMGTGTTGVVALRSGRSFVGVEASEEHFDIAEANLSSAARGD